MTTKQFNQSVNDSIKNLVNKAKEDGNMKPYIEHFKPEPTLPQGTPVMCNGYKGAIVRHYVDAMYEIRLDRGMICTDQFTVINKAKPYALQVCNAGKMPDHLPQSFSEWLKSNSDSIEMPLDRTEATAQWFDDKSKLELPF